MRRAIAARGPVRLTQLQGKAGSARTLRVGRRWFRLRWSMVRTHTLQRMTQPFVPTQGCHAEPMRRYCMSLAESVNPNGQAWDGR